MSPDDVLRAGVALNVGAACLWLFLFVMTDAGAAAIGTLLHAGVALLSGYALSRE